MRFEVIVQLKKEVLDPEGRAIHETLSRLGFKGVSGVTVSKRYVLDLEGGEAETAAAIARDFLANPVSETFEIRKI